MGNILQKFCISNQFAWLTHNCTINYWNRQNPIGQGPKLIWNAVFIFCSCECCIKWMCVIVFFLPLCLRGWLIHVFAPLHGASSSVSTNWTPAPPVFDLTNRSVAPSHRTVFSMLKPSSLILSFAFSHELLLFILTISYGRCLWMHWRREHFFKTFPAN